MTTEKRKTVSAYTDDALGNHDGVALAGLIAEGKLGAKEVVEAAIARARQVNPCLNAIVTETFSSALNELETIFSAPFSGVPTFIKDTDDVEGVPTRFGSRGSPIAAARQSSRFVQHYLALGFVSLGKSSLPEFGLTATTEPLLGGPTRNPWHLAHSTGGSSGGSAALVAAGVVPIAHANDGGGSIRIPAASCGLVGLKPTRGRLPSVDGTAIAPVQIVHQGILSRTVRDTAAFYAASDRRGGKSALPEIGNVCHPRKRRLTIGVFSRGIDSASPDEETARAVQDTAAVCEELGHHVVAIDFPYPAQLSDDFNLYWGMMAFTLKNFGRFILGSGFDRSKLEDLTNNLSRHFRRNILRAPMTIRRLKSFAASYARVFNRYDILLSPVIGRVPPPLGTLGPDQPFDDVMAQFHDYYSFTPAQNISGAPAISLPLARSSEGLPIGMQFAAAFGQDRLLLELALELEQARPWPLLSRKSLETGRIGA